MAQPSSRWMAGLAGPLDDLFAPQRVQPGTSGGLLSDRISISPSFACTYRIHAPCWQIAMSRSCNGHVRILLFKLQNPYIQGPVSREPPASGEFKHRIKGPGSPFFLAMGVGKGLADYEGQSEP